MAGGARLRAVRCFEAKNSVYQPFPRDYQLLMKPPVASYVSDFLKPDMLHIYRQITGLQAVTPWVLTHKQENAGQFPFPEKRLIVLPKPRLRAWRRFVARQIRRAP